MKQQPLVSCVMPTKDRPAFVRAAIRYFQRQDYPERELVVVDDGTQTVEHLVPSDPCIRYVRLPPQRTLGEKRNACVEAARADLIMHWDDDDWMAPNRISAQVDALLRSGADVCGLTEMLFYDRSTGLTWLYRYPAGQRPWLAGGSLLYTKDFWRQAPFPATQVASDTTFVWSHNLSRMTVAPDYRIYVAMIHGANTSPKNVRGAYWMPWEGSIRDIVGSDLDEWSAPATASPASRSPEYAILMVAHNALRMTQIATLRTLRQSARYDARLIVVDNASTDGTSRWLDILAQRGDIELLRNDNNIGHGPALEQARRHMKSRYVVTLDSDAFPLSDDWLDVLTAKLSAQVRVAGIQHHRDYIHPSCLLIERRTLDELHLSFLNEKDQPSGLDVAERISVELKRKGFDLGRLSRTSTIRKGSVSEPVYLGSQYDGIVHHQWYTTRWAISNGAQVDDVPPEAIARSLDEVLAEHQREPRTLTVVVGLRVDAREPERMRNARVCLQALNVQTVARWTYRIVVVEQGSAPAAEQELGALADVYQFAYNGGDYNRGWAFNVGSKFASGGALCLIDADLLVPPDFLARGIAAFQSGERAFLPYTEVAYLDAVSTERAIGAFHDAPLHGAGNELQYAGRVFSTSQGGCIWVDADLYRHTGGHDERFRGWGREDREFCDRLERSTVVRRLSGRLLHLEHPRPAEENEAALGNARLYDEITAHRPTRTEHGAGDPRRYAIDDEAALITRGRRRDWENWESWQPDRIAAIVTDELRHAATTGRAELVRRACAFGSTILDIGCGPGALWPHFRASAPRVRWIGADVTWKMARTARRMFPDVPVISADAASLPFPSGAFDVVVIRHVLEHLPPVLLQPVVAELTRVASRAVLIDFYVPPSGEPRQTRRVGQNFLETRWKVDDVESLVVAQRWNVRERSRIGVDASDELWILEPPEAPPARPSSPIEQSLKISIVMPTYLRPHTLPRTVAMVQAQTYRNWELIIVDNSRDTDYRFEDARVRVVRHAEVTSAAWARNHGLRYITGDLVCFFDDDDDMFPSYLQSFADAFMSHPDAKMVRCGMFVSERETNYTYATPECCLRRAYAEPLWSSSGPAQDQIYFSTIVARNRWSATTGDIVMVREALCRANSDRTGGLRVGRF